MAADNLRDAMDDEMSFSQNSCVLLVKHRLGPILNVLRRDAHTMRLERLELGVEETRFVQTDEHADKAINFTSLGVFLAPYPHRNYE